MEFKEIIHIPEPQLLFGKNQTAADPRDGLLLFGPYESWGDSGKFNSFTVNAGVVGTSAALAAYKGFVRDIKKPIFSTKRQKNGAIVSNELQRPSFPGFEAVFNIHWPETPEKFVSIEENSIKEIIAREKNKRIRTNKMVDLYLERIEEATREEDLNVNVWFILVPTLIYKECRASRGRDFGSKTVDFFKQKSVGQTSLFSEEEMFGDNISAYLETSSDFHNLLKARANQEKIDAPLQIIVEPKLKFRDVERNLSYSDDMKAFMAWSLSTTLYYKLGKKPWKISNIREGVCYLGLVFKKFPSQNNQQYACSAAQLFMSDGDGAVFRGNNGLWISENEKDFHLDEKESFNLLNLALTDFKKNNGTYPIELFIHGRADFSASEWNGFNKALSDHGAETKLVGIIIKDNAPMKLFRDVEDEKGNYGILRGTSVIVSEREAYLFTRGFVPRLNTSLSMETPNPLHIKISKGDAEIKTVLEDIMALTKLNYNTCIYGDGKPVTLRFSDTIGSILTATENVQEQKRQFKYYI
jgi:hypothetical protein